MFGGEITIRGNAKFVGQNMIGGEICLDGDALMVFPHHVNVADALSDFKQGGRRGGDIYYRGKLITGE
jgi:formylmethanofuran dehydrogenase subunit C